MINGQLIRVGTKSIINSDGFILRISILDQTPSHKIQELLEERLEDEGLSSSDYELIEATRSRISVSISQNSPLSKFNKLSKAFKFLVDFEEELLRDYDYEVSCFTSLMNLEQAFLRYASHQIKDKGVVKAGAGGTDYDDVEF